ncbi:MAG TPA: hypothetical protein VF177_14345, partial [Anaerolineae bacterium]
MKRNGPRSATPVASLPPFFSWLSIAAIVDWLITRTVTRAAIHVPKSPVMISGYQATNLVGQVAASLVALLALSP